MHEFHNNLPFFPERMKIEKVTELVTNLHDKTEHVIHIKCLKQTSNDGLIMKKGHGRIKNNQKAWLKRYNDMDTKQRKKVKDNFEKDFFKLMNNAGL